jgi:hypothetical protein
MNVPPTEVVSSTGDPIGGGTIGGGTIGGGTGAAAALAAAALAEEYNDDDDGEAPARKTDLPSSESELSLSSSAMVAFGFYSCRGV